MAGWFVPAGAVEAAQAGERRVFQGYCATLDGTPKWWDVVVTPIAGPGGRGRAPGNDRASGTISERVWSHPA